MITPAPGMPSRGYAMPEAAMDARLASDGHGGNVMLGDVSKLGAGEAGRCWTLPFARPR